MTEANIKNPEIARNLWYAVETRTAHIGIGREETHYNYVYAPDMNAALDMAQHLRCQKRGGIFPQVRLLSNDEAAVLREIINELGISMYRAQKEGLYGRRPGGKGNLEVRIDDLIREKLAQKDVK